MKNSKRIRIVFTAIVALFLCLGFGTVMFKGFVDFPCFVEYDEVNHCVAAGNWSTTIKEEKRIQVFLTTSQVGFSGGGCHAESSDNDLLKIQTGIAGLKFERTGNVLLVNGKELKPGENYVFTKFWNLNPWTVYTLEFTNLGVVPICKSTATPQLYVIGSYGNRISFIKLVMTLCICLGVAYLIVNGRKKNNLNSAGSS